MIIQPNDIQGGVQLQKVPVIPWEAFIACGVKVYKDEKIRLAVFDPQPMVTADEVLDTLRFVIAAQRDKPGPVDWKTVPSEVQQHFTFKKS